MRLALLLALLVLLAGCSMPAGGPADTETPTPTPAPTPTTPTDATAENTVAYGNLSAEAQAAFDAAREDTARFGPDSPYVDEAAFGHYTAEVFDMYDYVTRNDTYYAVQLTVTGYIASYHVRATNVTVSEDARVVAYENVSGDIDDVVRSAIENGSHAVPPGKWSSRPPALEALQFVRYEGETYRISSLHGDHPISELTVTPVE